MGEGAAAESLIGGGESEGGEAGAQGGGEAGGGAGEAGGGGGEEVFAKIGDQTFADAKALKEAYPLMTVGEDGKVSVTVPGAPDNYEFTAPEGHEIDPSLVELATPAMKDAKLTQDQAQAMVSFSYKMREHDDTVFREAVQAEGEALKAKLGEEYEPTKNRVNSLINKYSPRAAELRSVVVDQLGLGSKEVFVEFLDAVAKAISLEDTSDLGDTGGDGDKLTEDEKLRKKYPKMFEQQQT